MIPEGAFHRSVQFGWIQITRRPHLVVVAAFRPKDTEVPRVLLCARHGDVICIGLKNGEASQPCAERSRRQVGADRGRRVERATGRRILAQRRGIPEIGQQASRCRCVVHRIRGRSRDVRYGPEGRVLKSVEAPEKPRSLEN